MSPNDVEWSIRSVLIAVRDLDRSVEFYRDVMALGVLARDEEVAILGQNKSQSSALILREVAGLGVRHGQQALGARAVCINLDTLAALDRVEERLRALGGSPIRRPIGDDESLDLVLGQDPDGLPLVFLSLEGREWLDEKHFANTVSNVYGLDV